MVHFVFPGNCTGTKLGHAMQEMPLEPFLVLCRCKKVAGMAGEVLSMALLQLGKPVSRQERSVLMLTVEVPDV